MDVVGLGWEGILNLLSEVFGSDLVATVVDVVSVIAEGINAAAEGKVGDWVQSKIDKFIQELGSIADNVWDLIFNALTAAIPKLAATAIVKLAAKFAPVGWISTVIDIVAFFFNGASKLISIFNQVKDIFLDLIRGAGNVAEALASKIDELIRSTLPLVFDVLSSLAGIGRAIPDMHWEQKLQTSPRRERLLPLGGRDQNRCESNGTRI